MTNFHGAVLGEFEYSVDTATADRARGGLPATEPDVLEAVRWRFLWWEHLVIASTDVHDGHPVLWTGTSGAGLLVDDPTSGTGGSIGDLGLTALLLQPDLVQQTVAAYTAAEISEREFAVRLPALHLRGNVTYALTRSPERTRFETHLGSHLAEAREIRFLTR